MVEANPSDGLFLFADIARGYCGWCENSANESVQESIAASLLARLYAAALALTLPESGDEDLTLPMPQADMDKAKQNLSQFDGWYYRVCFDSDPFLKDAPVMGDVGDDLCDIYKDIKEGLVYFDRGLYARAQWGWVFNFRCHWGRHVVGALSALHHSVIAKQSY